LRENADKLWQKRRRGVHGRTDDGMTHSGGQPHTNVGDRGQRFEVRAFGYPKAGKSVIGWSDDLAGARRMATSIGKAPSCTETEVFDRVDGVIL
jgi:hypothetical protein